MREASDALGDRLDSAPRTGAVTLGVDNGGVFFGRNAVDPICRFWHYVRSGDSFRCVVDRELAKRVRDEAQGAQIDGARAFLLWVEIVRIHDAGDEAIVIGTALDL